jgi:hypothetical protein
MEKITFRQLACGLGVAVLVVAVGLIIRLTLGVGTLKVSPIKIILFLWVCALACTWLVMSVVCAAIGLFERK